jgi:hypothetical protein
MCEHVLLQQSLTLKDWGWTLSPPSPPYPRAIPVMWKELSPPDLEDTSIS